MITAVEQQHVIERKMRTFPFLCHFCENTMSIHQVWPVHISKASNLRSWESWAVLLHAPCLPTDSLMFYRNAGEKSLRTHVDPHGGKIISNFCLGGLVES